MRPTFLHPAILNWLIIFVTGVLEQPASEILVQNVMTIRYLLMIITSPELLTLSAQARIKSC